MRRVLGGLTAVAVWVAAVLFVTTVYQSPEAPLEVLSVDLRPTTTAVSTTTTRPVASTTSSTTTTVTTTTVAETTTTLSPTTTAPVPTTIPRPAPTTTAPPAPTTTAPPAPTTTAPPAPTTSAPPQTTTTAAPSGNYSTQAEAEFVNLINNLRASQGLGALTVHNSLTQYARNWSSHMAATGTFAHSNIATLLGPWSTVGENLAKGGSVPRLFDALKASPAHYANMVNGSYTHIGVGVWVDNAGVIWATHIFGG